MHLNGRLSEGEAPAPAPPRVVTQLRVFRVEEGQSVHVRLLSPTYGGCFTHYVKQGRRGRSEYCQGDDCPSTWHRFGQVWKGYGAAEVYLVEAGRWRPIVLELTESLELDFRDRWQRGQIWEIFRDHPIDGKVQPVLGKLHEERDPKAWPQPFDIRPTLLHMYHLQSILLDKKNPMPPRPVVEDSIDEAPEILKRQEETDRPISQDDYFEMRKRYEASKRTPAEKKAAK